MIKLIATDIDGTLVKDSTPDLYPEMIEAIKAITKQGVFFFVASGRTYESIREMFWEVRDQIGYVAENGAHIVYQNKKLHVCEMKKEFTKEILKQIATYQNPYNCVVSTTEGSMIHKEATPEFIKMMIEGYKNKVTLVDDLESITGEIIKIALYHPGSIRNEGENTLIPKWNQKVKTCIAGEEWVDFMDASVDKGNAIQFLQNHFGITKQETMTFGDNNNDIGLMEAAEESYAVENARDEVKRAAKHVCLSYDKKGVYEILKVLFMEGGEMDA